MPERDDAVHNDNDFEPVEDVELVGGALCFDFVNTGSRRSRGPFRERLVDYEDLIVWSRRAGIVDDDGARTLASESARRPEDAGRVLDEARALREAIYAVFSAQAAGDAPPAAAIAELNEMLSEAGRHRRLAPAGEGWTWTWDDGTESLRSPLWPIAYSAGELLAAGEPERVKECGGDNCNWLFYDASRNRSRRWCDMKDCGNRAKQRRHRHRLERTG